MKNDVLKSAGKIIYYKTLCKLLDPKSHGLDPYEGSSIKRRLTQMVPFNDNAAVQLTINGKVTGVGFRDWIKRKARVNGLECHAINRDTKTVEALLIGSSEEIEKLVRAVWRGPKKAKVTKVQEKWFNKQVKSGAGGLVSSEDTISWSQETADCYKRAMETISSIMEKPNFYAFDGRLVGTDELERASTNRNLFFYRCRKKEIFFVSPQKSMGMQRSQTTRVSSTAHFITDHKQLTKDFLHKCGLPVPKGEVFTDKSSAFGYLKELGRPVVVKPARGLNGSGVTVDVRGEAALETAWEYATIYDDEIILEELIQGVDIRVVIIGGKAQAALLRIPANVIGDGEKTIEALIDEKNQIRLQNPRLRKNLIIPDVYSNQYLERQGQSFSSIPEKDEVVFFHLKANICKGADSISVTDYIHPNLMELAEEAAAAFGINDYWGIDLLVEHIDRPREEQRCAIIELNSTANIENVIYPLYGPTFDSAQSIIDHLFPEDTKDFSYPEDFLKVRITGNLNQSFFDWAGNRAQELQIKGQINAVGRDAEATLIGYRHHLLFFLDGVWEWKGKRNYVVNGLQVTRLTDTIEEESFLINTETAATEPSKKILMEEIEENSYLEASSSLEEGVDVNTQLFLEAFQEKGYGASPYYHELIKIERDGLVGLTGMQHSTLFCDKVCGFLFPAKKLLAFHGLPVAQGVRFKCKKKKKAQRYFESIAKPCLITRLHPKGFVTNRVKMKKRFNRVWEKAYKKGTNNMLIEEYVKGWQVLVAVVDGEAVGALALEPVAIVGDGQSTIANLIETKNRLRKENPCYRDEPIALEKALLKRLKRDGYSLHSILEEGKRLRLESAPRFQIGGETANIDPLLHRDFYGKAIEAAQVFPGLLFAVVHMSIPYPTEPPYSQRWVVDKIDTNPSVAVFQYPWRGEPCHLARRVVDGLCLAKDGTIWIEGPADAGT